MHGRRDCLVSKNVTRERERGRKYGWYLKMLIRIADKDAKDVLNVL